MSGPGAGQGAPRRRRRDKLPARPEGGAVGEWGGGDPREAPGCGAPGGEAARPGPPTSAGVQASDGAPEGTTPGVAARAGAASSEGAPEGARDGCPWLDDESPGGWKPGVFRPEAGAALPSEAGMTPREGSAVGLAFAGGACGAGLLSQRAVLLFGDGAWLAQGLAEHGPLAILGAALAGGSSAALCAWRATGRRRRASAKHLRGRR